MSDAARLCALALWLLSCSKQPAEQSKGVPSATASVVRKSKLEGFTAKIDGTELPLHTALAFSRGGNAIHLTLSTHPLACDNLTGAGFQLKPGEVMFDLTLAPCLAADGSAPWHITGARLGKTSRQGKLAQATLSTLDPRGPVKTSIEATLPFPPNKLEVSGTLNATGCGILPWSDKAAVRPQKALRLEIAGKRLAINGASVSRNKRGESRIHLTSEPHACDSGIHGSDYGVVITVPDGAAHARKIALGGYSLATAPTTTKLAETIRARVNGNLEADAEVDLELAGETDIRGYRLLLDGTARAQVCNTGATAPR